MTVNVWRVKVMAMYAGQCVACKCDVNVWRVSVMAICGSQRVAVNVWQSMCGNDADEERQMAMCASQCVATKCGVQP